MNFHEYMNKKYAVATDSAFTGRRHRNGTPCKACSPDTCPETRMDRKLDKADDLSTPSATPTTSPLSDDAIAKMIAAARDDDMSTFHIAPMSARDKHESRRGFEYDPSPYLDDIAHLSAATAASAPVIDDVRRLTGLILNNHKVSVSGPTDTSSTADVMVYNYMHGQDSHAVRKIDEILDYIADNAQKKFGSRPQIEHAVTTRGNGGTDLVIRMDMEPFTRDTIDDERLRVLRIAEKLGIDPDGWGIGKKRKKRMAHGNAYFASRDGQSIETKGGMKHDMDSIADDIAKTEYAKKNGFSPSDCHEHAGKLIAELRDAQTDPRRPLDKSLAANLLPEDHPLNIAAWWQERIRRQAERDCRAKSSPLYDDGGQFRNSFRRTFADIVKSRPESDEKSSKLIEAAQKSHRKDNPYYIAPIQEDDSFEKRKLMQMQQILNSKIQQSRRRADSALKHHRMDVYEDELANIRSFEDDMKTITKLYGPANAR